MTKKTEHNLIMLAVVIAIAWTYFSWKKGHIKKY